LPRYLGGRVEGRTRFARLGLEVHSTAPTIRAGWDGRIMLELKNVGPLIIQLHPGARICQLILERVLTPPSRPADSSF
jgi:dCTP deaminase